MIWTVDRIEDGIAIIETPTGNVKIETKHLPQGVKEGNKLFLEIDKKEEKTVKDRIKNKMEKLFVD